MYISSRKFYQQNISWIKKIYFFLHQVRKHLNLDKINKKNVHSCVISSCIFSHINKKKRSFLWLHLFKFRNFRWCNFMLLEIFMWELFFLLTTQNFFMCSSFLGIFWDAVEKLLERNLKVSMARVQGSSNPLF